MSVTITVPESPTNSDIQEILAGTSKGLAKLASVLLGAGGISLNTDWLAGMLQAAAMLEQAARSQDPLRQQSQLGQQSNLTIPQMMPPPRRGTN